MADEDMRREERKELSDYDAVKKKAFIITLILTIVVGGGAYMLFGCPNDPSTWKVFIMPVFAFVGFVFVIVSAFLALLRPRANRYGNRNIGFVIIAPWVLLIIFFPLSIIYGWDVLILVIAFFSWEFIAFPMGYILQQRRFAKRYNQSVPAVVVGNVVGDTGVTEKGVPTYHPVYECTIDGDMHHFRSDDGLPRPIPIGTTTMLRYDDRDLTVWEAEPQSNKGHSINSSYLCCYVFLVVGILGWGWVIWRLWFQ